LSPYSVIGISAIRRFFVLAALSANFLNASCFSP
jgi:hypothetical protein